MKIKIGHFEVYINPEKLNASFCRFCMKLTYEYALYLNNLRDNDYDEYKRKVDYIITTVNYNAKYYDEWKLLKYTPEYESFLTRRNWNEEKI